MLFRSSITESMHKRAVKDMYRRTNRVEASMQVLELNWRTDKLNALRNEFESLGMIERETTKRKGYVIVVPCGTTD